MVDEIEKEIAYQNQRITRYLIAVKVFNGIDSILLRDKLTYHLRLLHALESALDAAKAQR